MSASLRDAGDATIASPRDEDELAAAIRDARAPLQVVGQATKTGMLRPVQAARTLSTAALTGITLYAPKELIISARAGTPLAEVEAAVAAEGQHLVAEPPDFAALLGTGGTQTIGGVVAANLSGPRRVAWGATRDHLMGVRAVNGAGELIRSGGRVLKNVTGLDICKLLAGSHGTLAVLSEVTLKVLPAPECAATLAIAGIAPEHGVAALAAALGSPYAVSGAAYLPADAARSIPALAGLAGLAGGVAIARLEDFTSFVAYRAARLRADLASFGAVALIEDAASRALWRAVRDALPLVGTGEAVWRVSVRPSRGPAVARDVEAAFGARWMLDWGGGLVWIAGPATEAAHVSVCEAAIAQRGTWTLMRAPAPLRAAVAVVPPEAEALARITRQVKQAFDPRRILNPGRLYAGL